MDKEEKRQSKEFREGKKGAHQMREREIKQMLKCDGEIPSLEMKARFLQDA